MMCPGSWSRRSNLNASSAEFVGGLRFRKPSQRVIKGHFHRVVGAESIGSSGYHSNFVVEALDGAGGNFPFGPEPVQQESLVGSEHPGDSPHRLQAAALGSLAPIVEKGFGPDQ